MERTGIIILNWNTAEDTLNCLKSLNKQTTIDFAVYLVENGSDAKNLNLIRKYVSMNWKYKLQLTINKINLGFAEGNNCVMNKAMKHEFVFILNNDTVLEPDCIENLVLAIEKDQKMGAVNPKMNYLSDKLLIWSAGGNYNKLIGKAALRGNKASASEFNTPSKVNTLVGAAALIRSEALKKAGIFDRELFCYYEETDLFERIKRNGYYLWYEPKALLYHKVASSTGGGHSKTSIYYLVRNRGYFITNNIHGTVKLFALLSLFAETIMRILTNLLKGETDKSKSALSGYTDFLLGKKGKKAN